MTRCGRLDHRFTVNTPEGPRELDAYTREGYDALVELWTRSGWQHKQSYEVTWLGIPIIQLPEDILMLQEAIWKIRPDVVIEAGVAHGGALIMYASMLELLGRGRVIGIDVEIRKYNRLAIESHPMSKRIHLIERSSIDPVTLDEVRSHIRPNDRVMVMLDSNHSCDHVRAELDCYAPLVTPGSYLVVFDSVMTQVYDSPNGKPEWVSDNPASAVADFLATDQPFEVDRTYERLNVTYCRGGWLKRRADD